MAVVTETREVMRNRDGDGGEYALIVVVDVDTTPQGVLRSETARQVTVTNALPGAIPRSYATNYRFVIRGGVGTIDSTTGDPNFPPVPAGQSRTWSNLNVRIDDRVDYYGLS